MIELPSLLLLVYLLSSYLITYFLVIKFASEVEVNWLVFWGCLYIFVMAPTLPFVGLGAYIGHLLGRYILIPILDTYYDL